jgi:hypothetical protein
MPYAGTHPRIVSFLMIRAPKRKQRTLGAHELRGDRPRGSAGVRRALRMRAVSPRRLTSQPHFPLDFFLGGLRFPVVWLTAGALGFVFLAITPPCLAFSMSLSSHHIMDLQALLALGARIMRKETIRG